MTSMLHSIPHIPSWRAKGKHIFIYFPNTISTIDLTTVNFFPFAVYTHLLQTTFR